MIDKKARLVGVDNNISYAYNHENTRVSKTVNAETTHFIYDGTFLAVISRHSVLDTESKSQNQVQHDELNLRFAGQYYDDETSTHYNINRDYNPKTGRYIESDPIGFDGGVNSYGYVGANPLGAVDEMEF